MKKLVSLLTILALLVVLSTPVQAHTHGVGGFHYGRNFVGTGFYGTYGASFATAPCYYPTVNYVVNPVPVVTVAAPVCYTPVVSVAVAAPPVSYAPAAPVAAPSYAPTMAAVAPSYAPAPVAAPPVCYTPPTVAVCSVPAVSSAPYAYGAVGTCGVGSTYGSGVYGSRFYGGVRTFSFRRFR